ncbi:MATE family efflux transporter [Erysipelothrix piscisicarius]|uniref:MATE family efflux transporter n=1 Tax=Erysipelothrix piscisicarius TaxID=2485784 RepID=UPI002F924EF6
MIGQLGDHALSGVATVNRYFIIAVFGTNGVIVASAVFMAHLIKERDEDHMKQTFRFSIPNINVDNEYIRHPRITFPGNIIRFFVKDPKVIEQGHHYLVSM